MTPLPHNCRTPRGDALFRGSAFETRQFHIWAPPGPRSSGGEEPIDDYAERQGTASVQLPFRPFFIKASGPRGRDFRPSVTSIFIRRDEMSFIRVSDSIRVRDVENGPAKPRNLTNNLTNTPIRARPSETKKASHING